MISRLATAYFGGAVAALVSWLALWIAGRAELTTLIGVDMTAGLSWDRLSGRLLWGSLWAMGYPLIRRRSLSPVRAGLILSLAPSVAELLIFMPRSGHGFLGLGLGALAPLVVLLVNGLWGWALARIMVSTGRA